MVRHVPIKQALQAIANNPPEEVTLDTKVWEAAAYKLYWLANTGGNPGRLSAGRKVKAQRILTERLAGRRPAGTVPKGVVAETELTLIDLTGGELNV